MYFRSSCVLPEEPSWRSSTCALHAFADFKACDFRRSVARNEVKKMNSTEKIVQQRVF
jgi:hypothetical protein